MTPEERQALRKKHRRKKFIDGYGCAYCEVRLEHEDDDVSAWPCDVIKVLDATEPVSETDPNLLGKEKAMTFEEWLQYGVENKYCTEQFCSTHSPFPMAESEEQAWEDGYDPCMHVVRLGSEEDWGY